MSLGAQSMKGAQRVKANVTKIDAAAVKGDRSMTEKTVATRGNNGIMPQAIPVQMGARSVRRAPADGVYSWDFEDESQFAEWTAVDSDGDGHNWQYFNMTGVTTSRMKPHEGEGLVSSASYDLDSSSALTPDNWLISPEVTLGGVLKLWACGQDASYASEVFGIYVCFGDPTNLSSFVQVGSDVTATGAYVEYEFDLSAYAGQTGHFAIRHYNVTDMFWLNIDDVTLDIIPDPTIPTNLSVTPGSTTADVAWEDTDDEAWNLRYKVYNPNEAQNFLWDCEDASQFDDWSVVDWDGDGNNWDLGYDNNGNTFWYSRSYSGSALNPDNWLVSEEVKLDGTLSLKAQSYLSSFLDNFGVFVLLSEDLENGTFEEAALKQVGQDAAPPTNWTEYTYDLSQFGGKKGYFIIRHYNSYDKYMLLIDDITLQIPGDEPAWIYVNNLATTEYTIEGLTPGTDYVVQVQAVNEQKESDWTEPIYFATPVIPANPTADNWYDCGDESGFSKFYFTLPTTDINGNALDPEFLSYSIYTDDDQLFTFVAEDYKYDLYEDITEVPYSLYSSAVDFHNYFIYLYRTNKNENPLFEHRIGIQAIYTVDTNKGPVVGKSDIVYWPLSVPTDLTVVPGTTTADVAWKDTDNAAWNLRYQVVKPDNQSDEWINVNNLDATEYTIEGLTPGTDYMVEVQAINGQNMSDWTEPTYFTTLIDLVLLDDDSQVGADGKKNSDKLTEVVSKVVQATLSGRTFFKDGNWNTLCLPFSLTEDQIAESPLAGATIRKFYDGDVTWKHVDIVFTEATEIEAGNFYIFKWVETGDDISNPVFKNVEIEKSDEFVEAKKDNDNFLIYGNFDSFPIDPSVDGCYTYFLSSEGSLKYSDKYRVLNTFRIFFRFTADKDAGALEFNLIFDDGNTQTGIVELDGVRKSNVNDTYNLQGVKVNDLKQKGIYIQNGRKVVIK